MNYNEFKRKYHNLVFAPLTFEPPPLDPDKLLNWARENHEFEINELSRIVPDYSKEKHKEKLSKIEFPFFDSYRVCNPRLGGWNKNFISAFPEILPWTKTIPVVEGKKYLFGFVAQRNATQLKNNQKPECSTIHVDEAGGFGLRYFIENNSNKLFFYGTKSKNIAEIIAEYSADTPTHTVTHECFNGVPQFNELGYPRSSDLFFDSPVQVKTTKNTAFLLGQTQAAHFVMHEHAPKFTFIVQPEGKLEHRYDYNKIDADIQNAYKTRKEEFIWYDDLVN